tara:strand:+ start:814 stop:942 length:129 start_codon:yes stop_codon:yes gene_type:complete
VFLPTNTPRKMTNEHLLMMKNYSSAILSVSGSKSGISKIEHH